MINLAIGRLDLPDEQGWLALSGSGVMAGLVGMEYDFHPGQEEHTQENISLRLRGSRPQLEAWTSRLEACQLQIEDLYLRLWSQLRQEFGYAKIHQLSVGIQPKHLESHEKGSLELPLKLTRETLFFSAEQPIPLSNSSMARVVNGLVLYNHDDAAFGHDNWFRVDANELNLEYPPLTRFQFDNTYNGKGLGDFWIGGLMSRLGEPPPKATYEAEAGSGGTVVNHSQASGGKYCQYQWSGASWHTLTSWTLGAIEVSQFSGSTVLPFVRFFNPPASSSIKLRLLIDLQGKRVFEGPVTQIAPGKGIAGLDRLRLPLGELPLKSAAIPHQLILQAKQNEVGEHLLQIDDLLLLPQQRFVGYHFLSGLGTSMSLVEDENTGKSWSLDDDLEFKSHTRVGTGLGLQPKLPQYFWCFQSDTDGQAPIDRTLRVRGWYHRRWRLP